jgi:hypothetical protein
MSLMFASMFLNTPTTNPAAICTVPPEPRCNGATESILVSQCTSGYDRSNSKHLLSWINLYCSTSREASTTSLDRPKDSRVVKEGSPIPVLAFLSSSQVPLSLPFSAQPGLRITHLLIIPNFNPTSLSFFYDIVGILSSFTFLLNLSSRSLIGWQYVSRKGGGVVTPSRANKLVRPVSCCITVLKYVNRMI